MRKILSVLLVLAFLAPAVVMAEEAQKKDEPGMGKMRCPMMSPPQMTVTSDGGVIVLVGPKLFKYDANLNLVNETELPKPTPPKGGEQGQGPVMGNTENTDSALAAASSNTQG